MKLYAVIITNIEEFEDNDAGYDDGYFDSDDTLTTQIESDSIYGIFDTQKAAQKTKDEFEDANSDFEVYASIQEFELNKIDKEPF